MVGVYMYRGGIWKRIEITINGTTLLTCFLLPDFVFYLGIVRDTKLIGKCRDGEGKG